MFNWLSDLIGGANSAEACTLTEEPQLLKKKIRVSYDGRPIKLLLGSQSLCLYPEFDHESYEGEVSKDWIAVDADCDRSSISGFARIKADETVLIGHDNERYNAIFLFARSVKKRHLEIRNLDGDLILAPLEPEAQTLISAVVDPMDCACVNNIRINNIEKISKILGAPIELLGKEEAIDLTKQVISILEDEKYRIKNSDDRPGGVLELPDNLAPVIIGDLHARIDNLLKILSENNFLAELERGKAYLLILGDTVHSELDGELDEMDSSLLMLDLVFKLKVRFPNNVFYLHGNHESFDESIGKGGVPQGLILKQHAQELRGIEYVNLLQRVFDLLPYVAKTKDYIACHAAPARSKVKLQMLVDIHKYPGLGHELIWNRLQKPNYPTGYTRQNVKRFRASLGVAKHTPFIVGHTHPTQLDTVWMNVGEIKNHHILMCANEHNLAVFIRIGHEMVPLEYPAKPLLSFVNSFHDQVENPKDDIDEEDSSETIEATESGDKPRVQAVGN